MDADAPTHHNERARSDGELVDQDRRRPGRIANASPQLIQVLRSPATIGPELAVFAPAPVSDDEEDDLRSARGILAGAATSMLVWAVVIFGIWCAAL